MRASNLPGGYDREVAAIINDQETTHGRHETTGTRTGQKALVPLVIGKYAKRFMSAMILQ